jgi:tRNA (guanine10-N2)-dimethyltransferase
LKNRSLVLLSGEGTTVPAAEARALFLTYDPESRFLAPSPRVLIADSAADPVVVGSRIAFSRRVGALIEDRDVVKSLTRGHRIRFRAFDLVSGLAPADPEAYLKGLDAQVDLESPEFEVTLVRSSEEYLAVTSPGTMKQGWSTRRPRRRPFFHPSAIFPKLARALVNLSGCKQGDVFLDPFAGTGSLPLEASLVGASVLASDLSQEMTRGALANMTHFRQSWMGVVQADSVASPFTRADAIATDVPYGRASSTRGRESREIIDLVLPALARLLRPSSRLVLMHRQQEQIESSPELEVIEEHHLHVHKLLTRAITVLRRR